MKRILKLTSYTLLFLLCIAMLASLYIAIRNRIFTGSADENFVTYLERATYDIGNGLDDTCFDKRFYDADVFLFGEIHGFAENQQLDKEMLLLLHKKLGLRNYIAETDSTVAAKLNSFLCKQPKDTALLKDFVREVGKRIPQQAGMELYEKWSALYEYNSALPDSAKIIVWGIDKAINDTSQVSRDAFMANKLRDIIDRHVSPAERYYGLFGIFHALQSTPKGKDDPLGKRLTNGGLKVSSLVSYMLESRMYMPKGLGIPVPEDESISLMNADGPLMLVKGINDLKKASGAQNKSLFRLDGTGSPYRQSQKLISIRSNIFGDDLIPGDDSVAATQNFQYLLLIKGSKAITPLR